MIATTNQQLPVTQQKEEKQSNSNIWESCKWLSILSFSQALKPHCLVHLEDLAVDPKLRMVDMENQPPRYRALAHPMSPFECHLWKLGVLSQGISMAAMGFWLHGLDMEKLSLAPCGSCWKFCMYNSLARTWISEANTHWPDRKNINVWLDGHTNCQGRDSQGRAMHPARIATNFSASNGFKTQTKSSQTGKEFLIYRDGQRPGFFVTAWNVSNIHILGSFIEIV